MEVQLEDIKDSKTLKSLQGLKTVIIECAKNIKSNDETFKITTLPNVSGRILELMSNYVETVQRYESCQKAFLALYKKLKEDEAREEQDFIEFEKYSKIFHNVMAKEFENSTTNEINAQLELEEIVRPYVDEDIQVEAPQRQVPKDPITKKDIKIAVKSTVCNHIYDKDGIEDYFVQKEKAGKRRFGCPQAGCTNSNLTRDQLVLDQETNQLIQSL